MPFLSFFHFLLRSQRHQFHSVFHRFQRTGTVFKYMQADRLQISLVSRIDRSEHSGHCADIFLCIPKDINSRIPESEVSSLFHPLDMLFQKLLRILGKTVQILGCDISGIAHPDLFLHPCQTADSRRQAHTKDRTDLRSSSADTGTDQSS